MKAGSGNFEGAYSFPSRMEDGDGANPEELVAAAHAGCYAMALSHMLASAGHTARSVRAKATVAFGPDPAGGFHIPTIDLVVEADVPGLDDASFQVHANEARDSCPISKLYAGASISLAATLV